MDIVRWHETGDYFEWRGQDVFYQEEGEGDAIILIHGFPTSSWDYYKIWTPLSQNYRVIAPDLIGHGYSSKPKDYHYSFKERAELIYAISEFLGLKEVHILARSYGVSVAQELMLQQNIGNAPVHIKSYCLLNGALFSSQSIPPFRQKIILSPFGSWWVRNFGRTTLKSFVKTRSGKYSNIDPKMIDDLYNQILFNDGLSVIPRINRYLIERREKKDVWEDAMNQTKAPIQLIWGIDEEDQIGGLKAAHSYRELVGEQYVVMLKDIGHFPHWECPDKVLEFYTSFLKGLIKKDDTSISNL